MGDLAYLAGLGLGADHLADARQPVSGDKGFDGCRAARGDDHERLTERQPNQHLVAAGKRGGRLVQSGAEDFVDPGDLGPAETGSVERHEPVVVEEGEDPLPIGEVGAAHVEERRRRRRTEPLTRVGDHSVEVEHHDLRSWSRDGIRPIPSIFTFRPHVGHAATVHLRTSGRPEATLRSACPRLRPSTRRRSRRQTSAALSSEADQRMPPGSPGQTLPPLLRPLGQPRPVRRSQSFERERRDR